MGPFHLACLKDLGCYYDEHVLSYQACEVARRWRVKLVEKLMCEAVKDGGDILQIGPVRKNRAEYLQALREIVSWTYEICALAGAEQGPAMFHVAAESCDDRPCWRDHHGRLVY